MELVAHTNKQHWIDNLRAIACIMVIVLHVSGPWVNKLQLVNLFDWWSVNFIHTFSRFCVPVFVMITGALVLGKENHYNSFYRQKIGRVIKPLLFWSIFYMIFYQAYSFYLGNQWDINSFLIFVYDSILYGSAYHLWYLYLIVALYVSVPALTSLLKKINNTQLLFLLLTWVILLSAAQYMGNNMYLNTLRFCFGYMGYMVLGYYIVTHTSVNKIGTLVGFGLVMLGILGTLWPICESAVLSGAIDYSWYYYLNVNVLVLSLGVFILFRNVNTKLKMLSAIAEHSFGIYLVHLFYIMVINKLLISIYTMPILLEVLVVALLVGLLSYSTIAFMKKINFLTKYVE